MGCGTYQVFGDVRLVGTVGQTFLDRLTFDVPAGGWPGVCLDRDVDHLVWAVPDVHGWGWKGSDWNEGKVREDHSIISDHTYSGC